MWGCKPCFLGKWRERMQVHTAKPKPFGGGQSEQPASRMETGQHGQPTGQPANWILFSFVVFTLTTLPHLRLFGLGLSLSRFLVCFGLIKKRLCKQRLEGEERRSCSRESKPGQGTAR